MHPNLEIITFEPQYKEAFVELNYQWLEEFFEIEPYDRIVLEQCETKILTPGGHIFMVLENQNVVGTFAFVKLDEGVYEFTKMAVRPEKRNQGIGNQMMTFSIQFAEQQHWKKLILYSNRILENSIYLYQKYGYKEIPIDEDIPYMRGDIQMELEIKKAD